MQSELLAALRARETEIRGHWANLLSVEPVNTPLAHPNALTHLIDWTLAQILRELATGELHRRSRECQIGAPYRSLCACGRNPLLAYFQAAGQALREALILIQATAQSLDPIERDASLEELNIVLQDVARREIEAFCGVCTHRQKSDVHSPCPVTAAHVSA